MATLFSRSVVRWRRKLAPQISPGGAFAAGAKAMRATLILVSALSPPAGASQHHTGARPGSVALVVTITYLVYVF